MFNSSQSIIQLAAISGATAVTLGAFGAHYLKNKLRPEDLAIFETGVKYQMYHTFALIACGILIKKDSGNRIKNTEHIPTAAKLFATGIAMFSFSLYGLALSKRKYKLILGPITPLGGLSLILGWVVLFYS